MLLRAVVVLGLGGFSVSLPPIDDKDFIAACVREHNRARSAVAPPASDMLYMSWDEALAATARAWARHCDFQHNVHLGEAGRVHPTFKSVGENIWTDSPASSFSVKRAVESWVNESQHYDYQKNSCRKVCGHYTQVVWAKSYKVGCAVQLCPNSVENFVPREAAIFVCNYSPGGNLKGTKPYVASGPECSGCTGNCENKLCRSPERDSQKSYSWTPDWDPASPSKNYVDILISRPIGLVLTFVSAYAVRHFYPNIFSYE